MSEHDLPLLPLLLADVPVVPCALGQEGIPVEHFEPQSLSGRFVLFDSSRAACPELTSDQVAIDVHALRGSSAEDPFALLDDEQSRRVRWWVGHLAVSEEVSRVDKRAARQQLLAGVRTLVEMAGGIWLRATAFPYPYRSAFNFRLDYDEYQAEDFATVLDIVAPHEECFSHFVCAASFENEPQALARLRGMDVGSHGYWHHTYDDLLENRRNVTRGVAVLRAHGIEPSGFVAPHGRFNRGLLAVLQELGVGHSSEFGLAYDELPFFPVDSNVLQVPVHPICLGICLEAAAESGGTGTPACVRRPTFWLNTSAGLPRQSTRPANQSFCTAIRKIGWDASHKSCAACWKRCRNSPPCGKRPLPNLPPGGELERHCGCEFTVTGRTS